jgi:hypothetical protein
MKQFEKQEANRRSFIKHGVLAAGVATVSAGLLTRGVPALGQEREEGSLTKGDVAILQLLLAAEIIETDLWQQYNEFGGVGAAGGPSQNYITALQQLEGDMPQYISDNTDDEISHLAFLSAYLKSKGHRPVNLDRFRNLPSSAAPGAHKIGRLTNLMQLSVDTSWWTRYRSKETPISVPRFLSSPKLECWATSSNPNIPGRP